MRNEKQNEFWVNHDLFKTSYLKNRITRETDFPSVQSNRVLEVWNRLQEVWTNPDIQRILNSPNVRESVTEDKWVDPVLQILGFKTLSKVKLGKKSYPDYTLFTSEREVADALDADPEFRYANALTILEGKYFGRDLFNAKLVSGQDDLSDRGLPPIQLVDYLKTADVKWGILTNGEQWQLYYSKSVYASTRYFEVNLVDLLKHPEITEAFCLFVHLFSPESFKKLNNTCRLDRVLEQSNKYAQEMGPSFFKGCEFALKEVFNSYQEQYGAGESLEKSKECHHASIVLLFRIIAIRYLEDRGILPTQVGRYRKISLDVIRTEIEKTLQHGKQFSSESTGIWQRLRLLFSEVNKGTFGVYPGHKGFESGLFDMDFDGFFRNHPLNDKILAAVVDAICRGAASAKAQFDFYDMGVEKIGDVYNDLLGLRLIETDSKKIILGESSTNKKEQGSYFTHPKLTRLVTDSCINYLKKRFPKMEDWLQLRIIDNSCGSGHFLRELVEEMSYLLYTSPENIDGTEDERQLSQNSFRRMLTQHCFFGIDRDIYAVWLTRLSLWLHSAEMGKPFIYLDPHVVQGDSILASLDEIEIETATLVKLGKFLKQANNLHSEDKDKVLQAKSVWDEIQSILRKTQSKLEGKSYLAGVPEKYKNSFFWYALRFPDVFLNPNSESKGFSIVVGNPPWDTVKPKAPEFYKKKTGVRTPPKRKVIDKWIAADEKRQAEYKEWRREVKAYANGIKQSGYKLQKGEVYTYSYFTERSIQSLQTGGLLSYVVKLGLYGDQKVSKLRGNLFARNTLSEMWIFKKNKVGTEKLFPKVDSNEKFLVFNCEKKLSSKYELSAKNVKQVDDIGREFLDWQKYPVPADLSKNKIIYVYDSHEAAIICRKMAAAPTLRQNGFRVGRELDVSLDRKFFSKTKEPVVIFTGDEVQHYFRRSPATWCKDEKLIESYRSAKFERIGVNNILPNSRRKLRACFIPKGALTANSILVVTKVPKNSRRIVVAMLNSMLTEYKLRPSLSNLNLNNFRLEALPLPLNADSILLDEIDREAKKIEKKRPFKEDCSSYKKIEGFLSVAYDLTNAEISTYLGSFADVSDEFIQDVIDYAAIARKSLARRVA